MSSVRPGRRRRVSFTHEGASHDARVRRHRGLRRLPRRLPAGDRRRADGLRARVSVRLARDPRRVRAVVRGADLRLPRARVRAGLACARTRSPACTSSASPTRTSTRWSDERDLGRARPPLRHVRQPRPSLREGRHADALLRRRADAARAAVPGRRRGAHRPADRRQGPEHGDGRRATCSPTRSSRSTRGDPSVSSAYSVAGAGARLARPALLLVDDLDAPPLRAATTTSR